MISKTCNFLFVIVILFTSYFNFEMKAFAAEENSVNFKISSQETMQTIGGIFNASISAISNNDCNISVFRLILDFDDSKLKFDKLTPKGQTQLGNVKIRQDGGRIIILYIEGTTSIEMASGVDTELFDIKFTINEESFIGNTSIRLEADGVGDNFVQRVDVTNGAKLLLQIVNPIPVSCRLKGIKPSVGDLNEEFNPDLTSYTMDVESSVSSITFDVEPEDENATVKVNRKTLLSQGSITDINITVKAKDGSDSIVYTVAVNRKTKEDEDGEDESSSKKSSSKNSSSSKSSSSKLSSSKASSSSKSTLSRSSSTKTQSNVLTKAGESGEESDNEEYVNKHIVMKENNFDAVITIAAILGCAIIAGMMIIKYKNNK